jgi:hypothetical protein
MIDPAKGRLEIKELTDTPANLVEKAWLPHYPIPKILAYDRGTEFMAEFADMIENDYGMVLQSETHKQF